MKFCWLCDKCQGVPYHIYLYTSFASFFCLCCLSFSHVHACLNPWILIGANFVFYTVTINASQEAVTLADQWDGHRFVVTPIPLCIFICLSALSHDEITYILCQ